MIEVIEKCDICKFSVKNIEIGSIRFMEAFEVLEKIRKKMNKINVIFTTNQNDGARRDPYLSVASLSLCKACMSRILNGETVYAEGAQGYNKYYFKRDI